MEFLRLVIFVLDNYTIAFAFVGDLDHLHCVLCML